MYNDHASPKLTLNYTQIPNAPNISYFFRALFPRGAKEHYTADLPLTTCDPVSIRILIYFQGVILAPSHGGAGRQLIDSWSRIPSTKISNKPAIFFSTSDKILYAFGAEFLGT